MVYGYIVLSPNLEQHEEQKALLKYDILFTEQFENPQSRKELLELNKKIKRGDTLSLISLYHIAPTPRLAMLKRYEYALQGIGVNSLYENLNKDTDKLFRLEALRIISGMTKSKKQFSEEAKNANWNEDWQGEDLKQFMISEDWCFCSFAEASDFTGLPVKAIKEAKKRLICDGWQWNRKQFAFDISKGKLNKKAETV